MVLNAQQKVKEKVLEKIIAQDQFSDGFREMRDSLLEIKQNKDRFLQLLEEVDFDNYRKSFLDELEESSEEFFNKKLNKNKDDIHSIYDFFGKNYKLTSKKNGFVKDSIKNLEILGFNITKTNVCTNNKNLLIKDKDGHLRTVYFDSVFFTVDVKSVKFDSEFEKNIPEDILEKFYKLLIDYLKNYNMYAYLMKKIESNDTVLLENIDKVNNEKVFNATAEKIEYFVNDILHQSMSFQTKMISVIYDFDEKRFRILDSHNTKNYKNRMFFGHIGNHERHKALFVDALFDKVEMEKFSDKLYTDFIKLAEKKISKTLTSNKMMSLSEVVKKNIPVNLLSDQQILESLRSTQSLYDIALIKDSITDEKQWARVLNIIDGYLNSIK